MFNIKYLKSIFPQKEQALFDRKAGVAICICGHLSEPEILFIERATNPNDPWSGQIAFPGGRFEESDGDTITTAIRETQEEVGVSLSHDEFVGVMPPVQGRRGGAMMDFSIHPSLFIVEEKQSFSLDLEEVGSAFWMPLKYICDPKNRKSFIYRHDAFEKELPAIRFPNNKDLWGLTYLFTRQLLIDLSQEDSFSRFFSDLNKGLSPQDVYQEYT
ncbi:MAG: CoA pyrophosphatase [Bdellovibrionales bacterium]